MSHPYGPRPTPAPVPGDSVKGILIYDVPRGTKLKAVELHDSMFSRGVTVPLGGR